MAYQTHPSNAAFLLGLGPIPGATAQQQAVAQMNAALDSGMFDHISRPSQAQLTPNIDPVLLGMSRQDGSAVPTAPSREAVANITIEVRVYGSSESNKKNAATVVTKIIVPADLPPADFFSRMHAQMNVDPKTAILGWKEAAERRGDPYRRLSSDQDVIDAFKQLVNLQKSTRRRKEVVMQIVNLEEQPNGKTTKKPEKPSETAVSIPELHDVQEKLSCMDHPGKNRWCYVMGPRSAHPGKHVPLGLPEVTFWARKIHDGEAAADCITPPSNLKLDQLAEKGHTREDRSSRNRGQPQLPPIHVHVAGPAGENTILRDVADNVPASRKRAHQESDSDSDDDDDAIPIADVLDALHEKYPALNYPQYSSALQAQGISYASSVPDFDRAYYKATIGMADGAIASFIKHAQKMLKLAKKRSGKKRARTGDKENSN